MRTNKYQMIGFIALLMLTLSCANFMQQMYSVMDGTQTPPQPDRFTSIKRDLKKYRAVSNSEVKNLQPQVKRKYLTGKKRFTASDLIDQDNEGSLWSGEGQDNYFFAKNSVKKIGSIVVINVMDRLKKEISLELFRTFAVEKKSSTGKDKAKAKGISEAAGGDEAKGKEKEDQLASNQIHDNISAVILEVLDNEHYLIRGRKEVLYKNRKRVIEVQAMVAKGDITNEDTVESNKMLESNLTVVQ